MLSKTQRIMKIADKFAYRYLCTAMTKEDIADFHWCSEIANVDFRDVLSALQDYEVEWIDNRWIVSRRLEV